MFRLEKWRWSRRGKPPEVGEEKSIQPTPTRLYALKGKVCFITRRFCLGLRTLRSCVTNQDLYQKVPRLTASMRCTETYKMQPLPIRILLSPCEPKILSRSCGSLDSSRQCVTQLLSFPFYRRHWHFRTGNLLQFWAPCHERKTNGSLRWSASDDGTDMEAHRSWQKIATVFGSNQILWVLGRKQKVKQNFMKHPPQGYPVKVG